MNVFYYPDQVFCLKECGNNALEVLRGLEKGLVYSEYAMIPFEIEKVAVQTLNGERIIDDYKELMEWQGDEA